MNRQALRRQVRRRLNRLRSALAAPLAPLVEDLVTHRHVVSGSRDRLHLGAHVSPMDTLFNTASGEIHVGDRTIFGHRCMVLTGRHEMEGGRLRPGADVPPSGWDVRIGSDCWIASGAIVLGGVTIGDGSIVAAGAVVTSDVPPGSVAMGVPARVVRRVEDDQRADRRRDDAS